MKIKKEVIIPGETETSHCSKSFGGTPGDSDRGGEEGSVKLQERHEILPAKSNSSHGRCVKKDEVRRTVPSLPIRLGV